jgi:CxxC-x17-CxxC domain-containing protein
MKSEHFGMSDSNFNGRTLEVASPTSAESDFEDKSIQCIDCSRDFIWTAGEQAFFRDKKLQNPPKRCKDCKQAKNDRLAAIAAAQASGVRQRIEVSVKCARCGESTTVPFYPSQGRPVFCRSCFLEMNPQILNPQG